MPISSVERLSFHEALTTEERPICAHHSLSKEVVLVDFVPSRCDEGRVVGGVIHADYLLRMRKSLLPVQHRLLLRNIHRIYPRTLRTPGQSFLLLSLPPTKPNHNPNTTENHYSQHRQNDI